MATNRNRYRRFRGNQKLARPVNAIHCASISVVTMIIEAILLILSVAAAGDNPMWMGSVGTTAAVIAIVCGIYNIKQIKKNTDFIMKWTSVSISLIAMVSWVVVFFVGVLN